jgi:hypothetical protein
MTPTDLPLHPTTLGSVYRRGLLEFWGWWTEEWRGYWSALSASHCRRRSPAMRARSCICTFVPVKPVNWAPGAPTAASASHGTVRNEPRSVDYFHFFLLPVRRLFPLFSPPRWPDDWESVPKMSLSRAFAALGERPTSIYHVCTHSSARYEPMHTG